MRYTKTAKARQVRKCLTVLLCDSKHAVISRLLTANVREEKAVKTQCAAMKLGMYVVCCCKYRKV